MVLIYTRLRTIVLEVLKFMVRAVAKEVKEKGHKPKTCRQEGYLWNVIVIHFL